MVATTCCRRQQGDDVEAEEDGAEKTCEGRGEPYFLLIPVALNI